MGSKSRNRFSEIFFTRRDDRSLYTVEEVLERQPSHRESHRDRTTSEPIPTATFRNSPKLYPRGLRSFAVTEMSGYMILETPGKVAGARMTPSCQAKDRVVIFILDLQRTRDADSSSDKKALERVRLSIISASKGVYPLEHEMSRFMILKLAKFAAKILGSSQSKARVFFHPRPCKKFPWMRSKSRGGFEGLHTAR